MGQQFVNIYRWTSCPRLLGVAFLFGWEPNKKANMTSRITNEIVRNKIHSNMVPVINLDASPWELSSPGWVWVPLHPSPPAGAACGGWSLRLRLLPSPRLIYLSLNLLQTCQAGQVVDAGSPGTLWQLLITKWWRHRCHLFTSCRGPLYVTQPGIQICRF